MDARVEHRPQDDLDLLRQALADADSDAGRHAASTLLGRYRDRVYVWCLRYVRDRERALDMAQEVLISAYRNLDSFEGRSQFGSWIFTITRNRCLSELRRPALLVDEEADPAERSAPQAPPDRNLEERLDEEALRDLIQASLDPVEQQALWLRCFEKMPVDEITRVLGIEETSGARGVLQRARRRLRAALVARDRKEGGMEDD
ncbi:MAG: sigma-70 family RNA polymerase sigma factor [bacterium]|nr:sigma-70 family RNA polymerase sigma factor [bacterium]